MSTVNFLYKNYFRFLVFFPVLILILFLSSFTNPVSAQTGIPPGSYKKTCKDIQVMTGNLLWAVCEKADGSYEKSTLQFTKCEGDISNNNGKLSCNQKPGNQPPKGSYQNTCKNIRVEGKQLKAKCEKKNGNWQSTSINYKNCKNDISNNNGDLSCNGGGGGGGKIPKGSYRDTCKNSYVEGNWLYSNCKKNSGSWNKTSMNYKNCNKDIKNDNGNLKCGGGSSSKFPSGSYKNSCKNLNIDGNYLEAKCKNEKGKWKDSSIKYKKCNNGIRNDNGQLKCN